MSLPDWQAATPRLVLASASATRRMLLEDAGLAVSVVPAIVNEEAVRCAGARKGHAHGEIAIELASLKALSVCRHAGDALVIGADQILSACGAMWSKPADLNEARRQLAALQGGRQVLHTAVVLAAAGQIVWRHLSSPEIVLRHASNRLLDAYVAFEGERLMQTVGALRIEGPGQMLIETVTGEHAAILGLPMMALLEELRRRGVLLA